MKIKPLLLSLALLVLSAGVAQAQVHETSQPVPPAVTAKPHLKAEAVAKKKHKAAKKSAAKKGKQGKKKPAKHGKSAKAHKQHVH